MESYRALFDEPIKAGDPRYGGKYDRDDYDVYQLSEPDEFEQRPFDPSDPVYGDTQSTGSADVTGRVHGFPEEPSDTWQGPYGTPIGPEWDGK